MADKAGSTDAKMRAQTRMKKRMRRMRRAYMDAIRAREIVAHRMAKNSVQSILNESPHAPDRYTALAVGFSSPTLPHRRRREHPPLPRPATTASVRRTTNAESANGPWNFHASLRESDSPPNDSKTLPAPRASSTLPLAPSPEKLVDSYTDAQTKSRRILKRMAVDSLKTILSQTSRAPMASMSQSSYSRPLAGYDYGPRSPRARSDIAGVRTRSVDDRPGTASMASNVESMHSPWSTTGSEHGGGAQWRSTSSLGYSLVGDDDDDSFSDDEEFAVLDHRSVAAAVEAPPSTATPSPSPSPLHMMDAARNTSLDAFAGCLASASSPSPVPSPAPSPVPESQLKPMPKRLTPGRRPPAAPLRPRPLTSTGSSRRSRSAAGPPGGRPAARHSARSAWSVDSPTRAQSTATPPLPALRSGSPSDVQVEERPAVVTDRSQSAQLPSPVISPFAHVAPVPAATTERQSHRSAGSQRSLSRRNRLTKSTSSLPSSRRPATSQAAQRHNRVRLQYTTTLLGAKNTPNAYKGMTYSQAVAMMTQRPPQPSTEDHLGLGLPNGKLHLSSSSYYRTSALGSRTSVLPRPHMVGLPALAGPNHARGHRDKASARVGVVSSRRPSTSHMWSDRRRNS